MARMVGVLPEFRGWQTLGRDDAWFSAKRSRAQFGGRSSFFFWRDRLLQIGLHDLSPRSPRHRQNVHFDAVGCSSRPAVKSSVAKLPHSGTAYGNDSCSYSAPHSKQRLFGFTMVIWKLGVFVKRAFRRSLEPEHERASSVASVSPTDRLTPSATRVATEPVAPMSSPHPSARHDS